MISEGKTMQHSAFYVCKQVYAKRGLMKEQPYKFSAKITQPPQSRTHGAKILLGKACYSDIKFSGGSWCSNSILFTIEFARILYALSICVC